MRTLQELSEQIGKLMIAAAEKRRNHAYIKGLRDAKKLIDEEIGDDDYYEVR